MSCLCKYHDELISTRRHLHTMPEEGWSEFTTTAYIVEKLRKLGYEVLMGKKVINPDNCLGRSQKVVEAGLAYARKNGVSEELLKEMDGLTGCVGVMDTGRPGPTLAIRFDIDCVPVTESTDADHIPAKEGLFSRARAAASRPRSLRLKPRRRSSPFSSSLRTVLGNWPAIRIRSRGASGSAACRASCSMRSSRCSSTFRRSVPRYRST